MDVNNCKWCNGTGNGAAHPNDTRYTCPDCRGTGFEGGREPVIVIPPVETWTLKDLKFTCSHNKVKGYTRMSRDELIAAVKEIIKNLDNK